MLQIPYKGAGAAMMALIGGETNVTLNGLFIVLPHIKSGRVKPVAVASPKRMGATPEIPTMTEMGVTNFVTGSWQGVVAPAGTPKAVVAKINAAFVEILNAPEMRERLTGQGAEVLASTPENFADLIRDQTTGFVKVAKESNIKPE